MALVELLARALGDEPPDEAAEDDLAAPSTLTTQGQRTGRIVDGSRHVRRLVRVDQKPSGCTPRSNLAAYTGLYDHVRKLFAATSEARRLR